MTGEFRIIPPEVALKPRERLQQISKEMAIFIWENFLKRYSESYPDTYTATNQLEKDLEKAISTNDQTIPKSLVTDDQDGAHEEFCQFLEGRLNPSQSKLFTKKLLVRPPDYFGTESTPEEKLGRQIYETKRDLDLQTQALRDLFSGPEYQTLLTLPKKEFDRLRHILIAFNHLREGDEHEGGEFPELIKKIKNGQITIEAAHKEIKRLRDLIQTHHLRKRDILRTLYNV